MGKSLLCCFFWDTVYMLNFRHISISDLFDLLTWKVYHTRRPPRRQFPRSLKLIWSHTASYSVFVCWYVTCSCDLDFWLFGLEQLSCMAGHMTKPATNSKDPVTIRSWVTSYNVSCWLPLKMRTRPLRMRRITLPVNRGSIFIAIGRRYFLYKQGCSNFLLKFGKFSLPWQQGSSEQSLTDTI